VTAEEARVGLNIELPEWLEAFRRAAQRESWPAPERRMSLAVELARRNVAAGSGGPFGAAVFALPSGELLAVGTNLVVGGGCSVLHAEMVAIILAQQRLENYDLGSEGLPFCELVTSAEPCAMCFGGVLWSGVRRLVCAAREEDVRAIGFDEGPKPLDWAGELQRRGVEVVRDLGRDEAAAVLRDYAEGGGPLYGPRRG